MKPFPFLSIVRPARVSRIFVIAGCLAFTASNNAQTFTNTGTTGANWSASTWTPSTPTLASGSSSTVLVFSGTLASAQTFTNDLGVFDLTTLTDSTGGFARTIAGSQLNFTGSSNAINGNSQQGGTISAALNFTNGLTFTSGQFSNYTLSGTITGSGGFVKNGLNGSLTISGNNSYTGGTVLNGNILTVNNNNALGGASGGTVRLNAGTLAPGGGARSLANAVEIAGNINFIDSNNANNLTLTGTVDLLGGTRTIGTAGTVANVVTLSNSVSNGGIVKTGVALLRLSGTNTYAGGTTINNGVVQFSTDASIPATGSVLINGGGALAVNQTSGLVTVADWLASGKIDSASTGVIALKGASSAAVDFSANGGYDLFLGAFANSAFTGSLTANGSTYRLGGGGATLTLSNANALTGSNTLLVGPALTPQSVGTTLIAAQTTSGGTVALSNSNDMTGATTVQSGTLSLTGAAGSLAGSDVTVSPRATLNFAPSSASSVTRVKSVALNGASLTVTGAAFASTDTITNALTLNSGANTVTVTPNASGSATLAAGSLVRTAGTGWALVNGVGLGKDATSTTNVGRITFTAAPTLVGTTDALSTGINSAAKDTKIVPWLVGAVTATTGGVGTAGTTANTFLTYEASTGLRPLNLADEFTNNAITTGTNTYITTGATAAATTAINSLVFGGTDAAGTLTINAGVTLTNTSGAILFTASDTIGGATGTLGFGSAEGLVTVNSGKTGTVTADITGTGGLSKFGAGTLTLTGAKAYTGATTINAGALSTNSLANGGSASGVGASSNAAANLVLNGGGLTYTGAAVSSDRLFSVGLAGGAIVSSGTGGGITFTNTGALGFNGESGARILSLGGTGAFTNTLAALIGDNGGATSVLKFGSNSVWVLSNENTYTGATQILGDTNNTAGTLSISSIADGGVASGIGASSNAASNLVINRGSLQYTGAAASTDRLFTIGNNGGTIDASGTGALNFTNTGAVAFTAPYARALTLTGSNTADNTLAALVGNSVEGTGQHNTGITKSGAGTWVLAGANTYSGATAIQAGTLKAGHAQALGNNSAVTLTNAAGALLDLNGFNLSVGSLAGGGASGGNVNLGNRTLTTGGNNTTTSYAGVIGGAGGCLVKTGTGTQTLTAVNTYTGATTISAGTLALGASGTIANSSAINLGTFASQGTLDLTAKTSFAFGAAQTLSGYGTVNIGSGKTVTVNGTLAPGNSPGILAVNGNLVLGAASTTVLEITGRNGGSPVAGADHDQVGVSGSIAFNGTLNIDTTGLAGLSAGDSFALFSADTYTAGFTSVTMTGAYSPVLSGNAGVWTGTHSGLDFTFSEASGILSVAASAVPEPAACALFLGLVALAGGAARRRSR